LPPEFTNHCKQELNLIVLPVPRSSAETGTPERWENTDLLACMVGILSEAIVLTEMRNGVQTVILANEAFQQLTGYSAEEIEGHDLMLLRGPETDSTVLQQLLCPASSEADISSEILFYRKDGTPFWDRVSNRTMSSERGIYGVQVHAEIASPSSLQQQHSLHTGDSPPATSLIHDFNNLLTAIMVYSGLLAAKVQNDAQLCRYADEIRASAERGAELIAQLLHVEAHEAADSQVRAKVKVMRRHSSGD